MFAIFVYFSIIIPIVLAVAVPRVIAYYKKDDRPYRWMLYLACLLFAVSWYLPSPLIDGMDTSFTTHFVGGGIFTGLVWWYLKQSLAWQSQWLVEVFSLFALVSALGCINELAEVVLVYTEIATITLADTSWDIVANTSGAFLMYVIYLTKEKCGA